jgi:hypothetical protein
MTDTSLITTANGTRPTPVLPTDLPSAYQLAKYIAASGLAPRDIKTAEAIFTAIQLGAEVGLTPMASLQNIAVVNGRPTIWGDAQLGLVRASGLLIKFSETYEGTYGEDGFKAVCKAGRINEDEITINEFSIADAKQAGLWGKDGPWKTNPKRMLKMRARAFTLRDKFTDILKGLYATEELQGVKMVEDQNASVAALNAEFNPPSQPVKAQQEVIEPKVVKGRVAKTTVQPEDPAVVAKREAQKEVENLYDALKLLPEADRPAQFLEVDGMLSIDKAGRNDVVDGMFADIGIKLPPREENPSNQGA